MNTLMLSEQDLKEYFFVSVQQSRLYKLCSVMFDLLSYVESLKEKYE